jgi:hypothetical protein
MERLAHRFRQTGLDHAASEQKAAGVLSCIVGALVFGALLPGRAAGFAAPFVRGLIATEARAEPEE